MTGNPLSDRRAPLLRAGGARFTTHGSHDPSDMYPRSVGRTGPIFRVDWDPSSALRGTPSQRKVGKEILFYPRMMTNRWTTAIRPLDSGKVEGMDWIH